MVDITQWLEWVESHCFDSYDSVDSAIYIANENEATRKWGMQTRNIAAYCPVSKGEENTESVKAQDRYLVLCGLRPLSLTPLKPESTSEHMINKNMKTIDNSSPTLSDITDSVQNVFWHTSMSTDPPSNFTPGLIDTLKTALYHTHTSGRTQRAALCYPNTVHVAKETWDRCWGCGYRNFLMCCTALTVQQDQPLYYPLLDDPWPPGVRNLQRSIESAWRDGFDPLGAQKFKYKLLSTKRWIGTAELYVAFVSRGIPARLVDFPKSPRGIQPLQDWIVKYFSSSHSGGAEAVEDPPVACTNQMPLILQCQGHSWTVIGYEMRHSGQVSLLVFEASRLPPRPLRMLKDESHASKISEFSKRQTSSPSKLVHGVLQSGTRKRKFENSGLNDPKMKREGEGGEKLAPQLLRKEILKGSNSDMQEFDALKIVQHFSLKISKLRWRSKYQILWFPMNDPMDASQRWEQRIVTSDKVS